MNFALIMDDLFQHIVDTPLGWFCLTGNAESIIQAQWINEEDAVVGTPGGAVVWNREAERQIDAYFKGKRQAFTLPLAPRGTDFQRKVWNHIRTIPFGTTQSYMDVAQALGDTKLSRAVGSAAGANPLLLLVPCHRLIGSDGELTGYAGGLPSKKHLLELEGALHAETQLRLF